MGKTFQKGNPGKPIGAVNKINQCIREKFEQLLYGVGVDQMVTDLKGMEPVQRMNTILGMAE